MEAVQDVLGLGAVSPTVLLASGLLICVTYLMWSNRRRADLPHGPPHIPYFGCIPFMRHKHIHTQFHMWQKDYGSVFTFYIGNRPWVVLNDYETIRNALVTQGLAFSGRAEHDERRERLVNPHIKTSRGIIDSDPSPEWKKQRSACLQILRSLGYGKSSIEAKIREEAACLIDGFRYAAGSAVDPAKDIGRSVANVICSLLFGERYENTDEEFVELIHDIDIFFRYIVKDSEGDNLPIFKLKPSYWIGLWRLKKSSDKITAFLDHKIDERRKRVEESNVADDFIECYLQEVKKTFSDKGHSRIAEDWLHTIVSDFFLAGAETTATTLKWALVWMSLNPEVQEKVQAELDGLVGKSDHIFHLADREKLPYTEATIMEIQRVSNIVPLSLEHKTIEDVVINGQHIPKDTNVWVNLTAVLCDPKLWPEPEVIRPERFLTEDGQLQKKEEWIPFSMGRRSCMGEQLARQELFLFFSSLIHTFSIKLAEGQDELDLEGEFEIVLKPPRFKVTLTPRW